MGKGEKMKNKHIVIFGATSGIATEVARVFAKAGASISLVGRREEALASIKDDLIVRGAQEVSTYVCNLSKLEMQRPLMETLFSSKVDIALVAYGVLGDQMVSGHEENYIAGVIQTNFTSQAVLCELLGEKLSLQKGGLLACITSVAGDRGRKSNYLYGSSKAGLSAYLEGLRGRLDSSGVHLMDIKPGFVVTAMTAHIEKKTLPASAASVGEHISIALDLGKSYTLYTPFFWRYIMLVVKLIPTFIFKKLNF